MDIDFHSAGSSRRKSARNALLAGVAFASGLILASGDVFAVSFNPAGGGAGGAGGTTGGGNGGNGGDGTTNNGGTGGLGGVNPGASGADGNPGGNDNGGGGGGGGGGGAHGGTTLGGNLTGGNGGNGGNGATSAGTNPLPGTGGGGGGGGAGGFGALIGGVTVTNSGNVTGGNGGSGGDGGLGQGPGGFGSGGTGGNGGNGGNGGFGIFATGAARITNTGIVQGGNGGAGGFLGSGTSLGAPGSAGAGGVGISATGQLNIINSGTIAGGLSGTGQRANAITFTGTGNSLELRTGSIVTGNVAGGSNNLLVLGGSTNSSFDVSKIGNAAQFQNFTSFQKSGTSTWTLTGIATQATDWSVTGGVLAVSSDASLGTGNSLFLFGGTLRFLAGFETARNISFPDGAIGTIDTNGNNVTLDGALTGTGGLTKSGTGKLTLASQSNTYSGATNVNGGTLEIEGVVSASNIIVNSGGTLSGSGKIGDPTINSGGTLAPGSTAHPYGTLTIAGPLTFQPGSFFAVNVAADGRNSAVKVITFGGATGNVTINGGTAQVNAGQGTYTTGSRSILTADGTITGRFSGVTSNLAFLVPTLTVSTHSILLDLNPNTPNGIDYRTAALTLNQIAVAGGLTNAGRANGGTGKVLTALNQLTVPQARAAFDGLSGEGVTAAQNVAYRSSALFTSAMFDQTVFYPNTGNSVVVAGAQPGYSAFMPSSTSRAPLHELADLPSTRPPPMAPAVALATPGTWRAWGTGFGASDTFHGNALPIGSATQDDTIYGGALGVDYRLMSNYRVGIALGGSDGTFDVPNRVTSGSTTGGHVAFYNIAEFGPFYGASSTAFSYFTNRTTRVVAGFGGLGGETERGAFDSHEFRSRLEFGRHAEAFGGTLTPFVALELANLRSNGFTETAISGPGNFLLNVSGQSQASVPSYLGARFQSVLVLGTLRFTPSVQAAWVHEFSPQRTEFATIAALPGSTFLVNGARPASNAAQVKAGGELALNASSALFASFDGEVAGVSQSYAGKGGFRFLW